MTLLQLEYLMEIYQYGSMNKAAQSLFVSQSAISTAMKELEEELSITIFVRSNRGISLTEEGREFISNIHPLLDQAKSIKERYLSPKEQGRQRLSICTQRYPFCAKAFVEFLIKQEDPAFHYAFKECPMGKVIDEVHKENCDLGIIFLSDVTEVFLTKLFRLKNIEFHEMRRIRPHVFMNHTHPLATKTEISIEDCKRYPFIVFTKKDESSLNFSEEAVLSQSLDSPQIIYVNDRATAYNVMAHTTAISTGSGVLPDGYCDPRICAIPIAAPVDDMRIGWIQNKEVPLSQKGQEFIEILEALIGDY